MVGQHRALVFCQLKAMMDIVENDLFRSSMPSVAYLRLDGSIPPSDRHEIVTKFNNDVSIDLLLLTTSVGEYILWKIFYVFNMDKPQNLFQVFKKICCRKLIMI